jgi:serine/threonine protein kinase
VRPVGTLVKGKWRITSVLRGGTAAALYLATARSGSAVALKIVHAHLAHDDRVCLRFSDEVDLAARLNHPAILRSLDEDVADDGAPLVLLEPLDGQTLDERCDAHGGSVSVEDAFDIAELFLDVLGVAHEAGFLHFEISPHNLFLTESGVLKVLDLGALDARPRSLIERGRRSIVWPAAYTAPELLLDEPSDARSDIWAVGALLYRLVTGSPARPADAPAESVASVPVRSLRESSLQLPRAFVSIVDRALEFDRADRWPDVEAMLQALRWARPNSEGAVVRPSYGGGRDSIRPSRNPLAEQAARARARSPLPEDAKPPSSVTNVSRWLRPQPKQESEARQTPQAVPPEVSAAEQTIVAALLPTHESAPPEPPRLLRRRASEPTLPSASLLPESEPPKTPDLRVQAMILDSLTQRAEQEDTSPSQRAPETPPAAALETTMADSGKTPVKPSSVLPEGAHGSDPPPSSRPAEHEPETLIRRAPVSAPDVNASAEVAIAALDALETDLAPSEPFTPVEPPSTVRIPSRPPPAPPLPRILLIASVAGIFVGGVGFALLSRGKGIEPATDVEPIETATAWQPAPSSEDAASTASAEVDAAPQVVVAAVDAAAEAATTIEDDAAAELEARLAAERRRRRERAAAEARALEAGLAAPRSEAGSGTSASPETAPTSTTEKSARSSASTGTSERAQDAGE